MRDELERNFGDTVYTSARPTGDQMRIFSKRCFERIFHNKVNVEQWLYKTQKV